MLAPGLAFGSSDFSGVVAAVEDEVGLEVLAELDRVVVPLVVFVAKTVDMVL